APHQQLFDLLEFRVDQKEGKYRFNFKFGAITNPWHAPYGFSHQLIQVYIDNDTGGATSVLKHGANVKFSSEAPWNKLIKISGWNIKVADHQTNPQQEIDPLTTAKVKVLNKEGIIRVSIPQKLIGDLSTAKYYVLVGSLDGFSYDNYRPVIEEVSEWKFGGGSDSDFNPNVIDILTPEDESQKEILGAYSVEEQELATLYPVSSNNSLLNSDLLLGLVIFALLILIAVIVRRKISFEM
ncbi:MAG: glucodextranase DOMON-like domain-containing protein, partial [Bacillota bacterium]